MTEADPERLRLTVHLTRSASTPEVAHEEWPRARVTPASLQEYAREKWGVEAYLLHDGGLLAGRIDVTVVMEERGTVRSGGGGLYPAPALNARPWQLPGWHAAATSWLDERLGEAGEARTGSVVQVSTYDLACVLRAATDRGGVYLKASDRPHEALATRSIAAAFPGSTPEVLGVREEDPLLLTRDAGRRLHEVAELEPWVEAVSKLADLQREGRAVDLGMRSAGAFEDLAADGRALALDGPTLAGWGLGPDDIAALPHAMPALAGAHDRVSELGLPALLAHGDAHPMNALTGPHGTVWFDWAEAGVAHPFLDAGWFFAWLTHPARAELPVLLARPDTADLLWRHYLDALGVNGAEGALADAKLLALAHRAIGFDRRFRDWEGTVPGWRPMYVPYYLRWLIRLATASQ